MILAASRQVQTWCQKFENWCPTGSRLDPDWPKAVPKNAKIGARLGPDWVPTGSRPGFFKKTPISLNLSTYFWNFSTLPCTTPPLRFPLRTPPTSLKPNTGNSSFNRYTEAVLTATLKRFQPLHWSGFNRYIEDWSGFNRYIEAVLTATLKRF